MAYQTTEPPTEAQFLPEYLSRELRNIEADLRTPTWITATLQNSWVVFGSTFASLQYRKERDNRVWFRGVIKDGTTTDETTICTLPEGYRPVYQVIFPVLTNPNVITRLDLSTAGDLSIETTGGGTTGSWISLDGLSFMAEQ